MPHSTLLAELLYWFGFLVAAAFGLPPIPEELIVAMGGIRASQLGEYGDFRWLLWPACFAGAFVADLWLYALGLVFGARLLDTRFGARLAPLKKRDHIRHNLERYGLVIFVIGRLVPGIRLSLFLTAGSMRLPLWRFCLADGIGAAFGTTLFFMLGYALGAQFKELLEHLEKEMAPYKPVLLLVLLGLVAAYLLYSFYRHPVPTGDPEEVPIIGHQIAVHLPEPEQKPVAAPETGVQEKGTPGHDNTTGLGEPGRGEGLASGGERT